MRSDNMQQILAGLRYYYTSCFLMPGLDRELQQVVGKKLKISGIHLFSNASKDVVSVGMSLL